MTSTTLSSKGYCITPKEFGVLFKWALKRNRALMVVHTIILAVVGPVFNIYVSSTEGSSSDGFGVISLMLFVALSALFTLISAIKTFSFLHNKRSVDLYGAMPCNRFTMYLSHLLAGIASVAVPYIIVSVITLGISSRSGESLVFGLNSILFTLLMIMASYTFTVLMAYCCGTVVDTIIVTFAVNIIWVSAVALYYGILSELIPGATFDSIITTPVLSLFAPYSFGYMGVYAYYTDSVLMYAGTLVWFVLFTAASFAAAAVLAKKRKAESSQNGFAVKWLPMFIKAGASVIAGALFGYIFASISENGFGNMIKYCFWYILIGAVAFFVLHIIFARGLKGKYLKSVVVYSATTLAALLLVFAMCFGMGLDMYVPNPGSVKSVTVGYGENEYTDPESIRLITEIHKVITEGIRKENDYPYYLGYCEDYNDIVYDSYDYDYDYYEEFAGEANTVQDIGIDLTNKYAYLDMFEFQFKYKMKNGIGVVRDYYISSYNTNYDKEKLNELCKQFVNTDEYKKKNSEYLFSEEKRNEYGAVSSVSLEHYSFSYDDSSYTYDSNASLPADQEFMNGLYKALQKDVLADKEYVPMIYSMSRFSKELGKEYMELSVDVRYKNGNDEYRYGTGTFNAFSIVVKDSYENTLKYISDNKIVLSDLYEYNGIDSNDVTSEYYYMIMNDYNSFIETGEYSYLKNIVDWSCNSWASDACVQLNEDIDAWFDFEYELDDVLDLKVREIYNKFQKDHGCDGEGDIYCPMPDEAEEILVNIREYVYDYVAKKLNKSNPDTDTSSEAEQAASDTDKNSSTVGDKSTDSDKTASGKDTGSTESKTESESKNSKQENSSSTAESKAEKSVAA